MMTKRRSAKSSPSSSLQNRAPKRSRVARDMIAGLKEAAAFMRGEISLPVRLVSVPASVDVKAIRSKLRLSQPQFAKKFGFSPRTLQEWEQGRAQPDSAVRAYLQVIDRNAKAVEEALSA